MTVEIVDYAYPCMMAERALKKLHDAMLARKYDEAMSHARTVMVEAKITYNSILHEKEKFLETVREP
jgi:hypothetical protein